MKIYVYNLSYDVTENNLFDIFNKFGAVQSVTILKENISKVSKGIGFVVMPDENKAAIAIKNLNSKTFKGRKLKIKIAPDSI